MWYVNISWKKSQLEKWTIANLNQRYIKLIQHIGVNISLEKLNTITTSTWKTMEKFFHNGEKYSIRKDCKHVRHVKKDLKILNPTNLNLPEEARLYTNDNLNLFDWRTGMNIESFGKIRYYSRIARIPKIVLIYSFFWFTIWGWCLNPS